MANELKPIVVIYFPDNFYIGNGEHAPTLMMKALNGGFGGNEKLSDKIKYTDYWNQYYWFCFEKHDIDAPEFQVFHPKDFTDIQFEELKKMVSDAIVNLKTTTPINGK